MAGKETLVRKLLQRIALSSFFGLLTVYFLAMSIRHENGLVAIPGLILAPIGLEIGFNNSEDPPWWIVFTTTILGMTVGVIISTYLYSSFP